MVVSLVSVDGTAAGDGGDDSALRVDAANAIVVRVGDEEISRGGRESHPTPGRALPAVAGPPSPLKSQTALRPAIQRNVPFAST